MENNNSLDSGRLVRIRNNPQFQELVKKRTSFAWFLSILMLLVYYGFILVLAFAPQLLGQVIQEGSVITWGIPVGVFIIVFAFILTGIYVQRANGEFDDLVSRIKEDSK